jgi:single-strand DNA-binding protein
MANFNKVILVGNLTRDPEMRFLPSQMAVVDFGLAINHRYRTASGEDREEVCFIDCSAFGKTAETINQYCKKGKPILVEGRLKYETWEDKQGGGKRSKHKIVIDGFQFLGSRDGGASGGAPAAGSTEGGDETGQPAPRPAARPAPARPSAAPAAPPIGDEEHFKENDIPF